MNLSQDPRQIVVRIVTDDLDENGPIAKGVVRLDRRRKGGV